MRNVLVTVPTGNTFLSIGKRATKVVPVNADEIHISTHGVLVLKRYGNIVETYAHGEWLKAQANNGEV